MTVRLALALLFVPAWAAAIPRFAIRTGIPCGSCHVSPTGGGMRLPLARDVYARQWLAVPPGADVLTPPSVDLGAEVAIGADLRAAWLFQNSSRPEIADTSGFSLMQADLYLLVQAPPSLGFYLDTGVYGGFEAFALWRPAGPPGRRDFVVRAGRFVVPFGLRDVNHTTWVREGVGLGPVDRDTGVEVALANGGTTVQAAVTNGTYGAAFVDTGGTRNPRPYDLASSVRFTDQRALGPARLLFSASGMYNRNAAQQNPLFVPALFQGSQAAGIQEGVDEFRIGGAFGVGVGRLGYRAEVVWVGDRFRAPDVRALSGYASGQEVSVVVLQGLEVALMYEFADADIDYERGRVERLGAAIEWFAIPGLELALLARHQKGPVDYLLGARDDVLATLHVYL